MSRGTIKPFRTLIVSGALMMGAGTLRAEPSSDTLTKTFDAASVKRLRLESAAGSVAIKGGQAKSAEVVARKHDFDDGCTLAIEQQGDALVVANKEPSGIKAMLGGHQRCEVAFEIELPRQVALDVELGTGDVTVADVEGQLSYRIGSGDVELRRTDLTRLDGRSGSGDLALEGRVGEGELKIGAGNVAITMPEPPASGSLDLKVGTGSTVIKLPREAKVRSTFKAGLGSLTNELGDAPDARYVISGKTGAGDLTIRKL